MEFLSSEQNSSLTWRNANYKATPFTLINIDYGAKTKTERDYLFCFLCIKRTEKRRLDKIYGQKNINWLLKPFITDYMLFNHCRLMKQTLHLSRVMSDVESNMKLLVLSFYLVRIYPVLVCHVIYLHLCNIVATSFWSSMKHFTTVSLLYHLMDRKNNSKLLYIKRPIGYR